MATSGTPTDTRPDGCGCLYDDGYITTAAARHNEHNEQCPLFDCPECEHEARHHGANGCEVELGDRWFPSREITEAGGPCPCKLTQADITEDKWKAKQ
jgi:hypothetical protein